MSMISNGTAIARTIIETLKTQDLSKCSVAFIQFGNDPASTSFVAKKIRIAKELGIATENIHISSDISIAEACTCIRSIAEKKHTGIVVQLPLPPSLDIDTIISCIPPDQDIDALRTDSFYRAPVACAVQEILSYYDISTNNSSIVIVGNGRLVGAPVYKLFKTHSHVQQFDKNSDPITYKRALLTADIVITGTGVPHSITSSMIKEGCVLIDAGTSEQHQKIVGDCHPDCAQRARLFSTTPGGIGPITIACLFQNISTAHRAAVRE